MIYGYNRVSSTAQNLDRGNASIESFCQSHNFNLEKIYVDKQTGSSFDRPRYLVLKEDVVRPGDIIVIPEYDRFGRADQAKKELEYFKEHDIRIIFLDIPTTQIDLSTMEDSMAKMILSCINDMLISFYDCIARTELQRRKKRQMEGYEALRARGEWSKLGRPQKMTEEQFASEYEKNVISGEISSAELCKRLDLTHKTYFRYVKRYKVAHGIDPNTMIGKVRKKKIDNNIE